MLDSEDMAPESKGERPTIPVPPEKVEARVKAVFAHCKGLSFGASIAVALFEKGPLEHVK